MGMICLIYIYIYFRPAILFSLVAVPFCIPTNLELTWSKR